MLYKRLHTGRKNSIYTAKFQGGVNMFETRWKSAIEGKEVDDPKADHKTAKRTGRYKFSEQAVYLTDERYIPYETITEVTRDKASVHVSGCCAGGVMVDRLLLTLTNGKKEPLLFDSGREVEKALEFMKR